ncbi:MAG: hypothetical protein QOD93_588 [Acetobacteraceae bacterium]|jgi:hypothetical protein|nr:hypothetical protein [Rhodopila sp.]MEA2727852.1 hypothetical protein [Acetobacteraceae bacterium]MEA2767626.1 hypothetical protein [Acetobacteraceae bacterium]
MTAQPTLFMRIHKTASESLAQQVCDRLPADIVCPAEFEWQVRNLAIEDLRQFSYFQGHITPSSLSAVFSPLRVFTMLRAPRERLLSCFFYWKEGSKYAKTRFFNTISTLSLAEFLRSEDPIIRRVTWNVQARLLAGGQFGGEDALRQNVFGPWLPDSDLAAEATRALDRFAVVGIAESYEASLRKVYALLELGEPPPPERINVTSTKPPSYHELLATPEIADALFPLTRADEIVYEAACRRLNAGE